MTRAKTVVGMILLALLAAGCGSPAGSPAPSALEPSPSIEVGFETTQRNEGGEVTVEVTWNGPAAGAVFDVKLDTHSVDLDALDLTSTALVNDRGESLSANAWEAPDGGHHREGRLTFSGDAGSFFIGVRWIELTIYGVGGVPERVLRWEVPA